MSGVDQDAFASPMSTDSLYAFAQETNDGFLIPNPSGDRVLTRRETLELPHQETSATAHRVLGARLRTDQIYKIGLISGSPWRDTPLLKRVEESEPLRAKYMKELGSREGLSPINPTTLPDTLFHAALCVIEREGRVIDQVDALRAKGQMGSEKPDALFFVSVRPDWSLKEVPLGAEAQQKMDRYGADGYVRAHEVMLTTIDAASLTRFRDVYPDPESIGFYSGEWGVNFIITGGLPVDCIKKVEIFDQEVMKS